MYFPGLLKSGKNLIENTMAGDRKPFSRSRPDTANEGSSPEENDGNADHSLMEFRNEVWRKNGKAQ